MNTENKYLIAKEIELGFLRIPSKIKKYFPKKKTQLKVSINGIHKSLHFNPTYNRITGLTGFYRSNQATPNDIVCITIGGDKIKLDFKKFERKEKYLTPVNMEQAKEIIDISGLSSQAKGNIVEQRIAELILLYGQGFLNVYKPIADIEGIDLIVVKRGYFQPIFIQVKSRYNLRRNLLQIGVKKKGFIAHHSFFIVGAYFNPAKIDIDDYLVFIPSLIFEKKAIEVRKNTDKAVYVLNTPLKDNYSGKYTDFVIKKENLVNKILEKFEDIQKYLK